MASIQMVRRSLEALRTNYGKSENWVEDSLKLWSRGLHTVHDRDLARGVEDWCRKQSRAPNLARLKATIEANPLRVGPMVIAGCPACNQTGFRELARWHWLNETLRVDTFVSACDCAKGRSMESATIRNWSSVVDSWRDHPLTEAVFHSTAERYHLTTEERHTPHQLEAMAERARKMESVDGWKKLGARR
tara:strand:+ start:150 stop:719 length:570 start_codon:yes stop_codon:yes gene_type:complete